MFMSCVNVILTVWDSLDQRIIDAVVKQGCNRRYVQVGAKGAFSTNLSWTDAVGVLITYLILMNNIC